MIGIALNPAKQKKRLRWILFLFFIAPSVPVYYLLQTIYSQLENEAYFSARHQAEILVDQVDLRLQHLLEKEQKRPIAEYQFFNVMENQLLSETAGVKFSPLSEIPPKTDIKGLIGYFQINTDGSFHLPALPELGQDNISGLSLAELESRLKLKTKLQNLLSTNVSEKKRDREESNKEFEDKTKTKSILPSLSREKLDDQHSLAMDDESISAVKPLASIKGKIKQKKKTLDKDETSLRPEYRSLNKLSKPQKKYITRKEIVQLPDQGMASSYFNRSILQQKSIVSERDHLVLAKKENTLGGQSAAGSAINVFSFESEVTPLQLLSIGQKFFCFYRYVWHDNHRYTQGFVVKSDEFLMANTTGLLSSSDYSSLLFSKQGDLIQKISIASSSQETQLYSRSLSMPFQKIELIVNASKLVAVPGGLLIDLLALSIYCIFIIGFIAFYRLGSRQIDLAKQQQNFISAVSHELKTPLTSIRMYGEMLRSGWVSDDNKKQQYYDFIFFESERLSRLIANVLRLARIGHQQQTTSKIIVTSAESLLNRMASKLEAQIEASSFKLKCMNLVSSTEQIDINVDEDAFFQIMINLLDNAIKFANKSANKRIDIGYKLVNNRQQVIFFIRDYGPGIKKNQLKKIFQLFYRCGDELTRTTPGTGIGLALVAQLAESMHASVDVSNKKPGTEFQIKLPRSDKTNV